MQLTPEMVARCFRVVPEPERIPFTPLTDAEVSSLAGDLAAGRRHEPIWVFAYGSLIWKPIFVPAETRRARAHGWHRSFCIEIDGWRGTPENPGLMMALVPGGSCVGLVMRLAQETMLTDLGALVRREMPYREFIGNARWITVESAGGPAAALTFYARPVGFRTSSRLPLKTVAERLAKACGYAGSCAEYLHNTVSHLEAEGIRDRNLWQLQRLVAEEVSRWPPAAEPQPSG